MTSKHTATADIIGQNCIAVRVRILNRVITKIYDDSLRPFEIKTSQMNILVVTARLGLARPSEICSRLKMDMSTVSRNIDRLRSRGWIEIVADDRDARAHQVQLSRKGADLIEKAAPAWEQAQKKTRKLLGRSGVTSLLEAVEKVRNVA